MHSQLYCILINVLHTPIIPVFINPDPATISFSPQNYTVQEGYPVDLSIVLDRPFSCADKYPIVFTRDDTAKCEWKVLLHRNTLCNNGVNSFSLFLLHLNA